MYLMESKEDESVRNTEGLIKRMIKSGILGSIDVILTILLMVFKDHISIQLLLILIMAVLFIWQFLQIRMIIRTLKIQETNEMIFGNQYENIDLNNEKLLVKINKINVQIGKIEFTSEYITFVNIIYIFILGYLLCNFLSLILI